MSHRALMFLAILTIPLAGEQLGVRQDPARLARADDEAHVSGETRSGRLVLSQDFNWHDASGKGEYTYGADGYLSMDGSTGEVRCHRFLKKKIVNGNGGLEVKLKVVLGRPYHIRLVDQADRLVVDCLLDRDGWVRFRQQDQYINSKIYLTFPQGVPYVDPAFSSPSWYARESDDMTFTFSNFDFAKGDLDFSIRGPSLDETTRIEGCLSTGAREISRLELHTGEVEPGTMIRLAAYKQYEAGKLLDHEEFLHYWNPVPAPPDGYPQDNMTETRLRPVDNQWLETSTGYGWVRTSIPLVTEGEITFEMKTPNIALESALELMDSQCVSLLERLQNSRHRSIPEPLIIVGILEGKFFLAAPGKRHSKILARDFYQDRRIAFEEPVPVANRTHRFKLTWSKAGHYRLWIDDVSMKVDGSVDLPLCLRPGDGEFRGFDTIFLHTGWAGVRTTLAQQLAGRTQDRKPPHLTYWRRFRLRDNG